MIALDSIEIVDKDLIQVSWFDNGNHWETWDSSDIFNHIVEQQEEIERLNNIINELEKFICDLEIECNIDSSMWGVVVIIHNKLKELKGSDKE